MSNRKKILT